MGDDAVREAGVAGSSDVTSVLEAESLARTRRKRRRYVLGALALVITGAFVIWAVTGRRDQADFRTQEARRGDLIVTISATGNLEPTNQVEVGVEVSGTVENVEVDYNDEVERGQILARLDPTKFNAQVVRSRAALQSARARVLQAQATVEESRAQLGRLTRLREVSKGTDPSQHDIDAARAALKRALADRASAKADVAQAEASLESAEIDLAKSVIHSPVDGVVLERSVEPGQTVAASLQTPVLFVLAEDLTNMELHVSVDEADVGRARAGQKATFTVDAYPDRTFSAEIVEVHYGAREVDGVITYEAVLNVDNTDLSLRPGMTATATVVVEEIEDALLIPNAALRFSPPVQAETEPRTSLVGRLLPRPPRPDSKGRQARDDGRKEQRVWILEGGQPVAVPVTVGATDGLMTELIQGNVEPGMPLVIEVVLE
ncbi:MAG TPA: efflux RND transporter periplasmic adaptor subunit [Polyangiales bacterium]|nr:efflux RND transporter periplasmic adaptor subunit [Polyangiales bacterium]